MASRGYELVLETFVFAPHLSGYRPFDETFKQHHLRNQLVRRLLPDLPVTIREGASRFGIGFSVGWQEESRGPRMAGEGSVMLCATNPFRIRCLPRHFCISAGHR